MKITTVIPFYNRFDLVHCRLRELYSHLPENQEIILVDDSSTDADAAATAAWWQKGPLVGRLKYFKNPHNVGFGASMNKGVKIAAKNGADAVVLLSNDVEVKGNYITEIDTMLSQNKNILIGGEMLCHDTGWNVLPDCGPIPYLNGWFLACHVDVWNVLGGFDPEYGLYDYEDVDLSTTAWIMGVRLEILRTVRLKHLGGQTINKYYQDRVAHTLQNQVYWKKKWKDRAKELQEKIYGIKAGNS